MKVKNRKVRRAWNVRRVRVINPRHRLRRRRNAEYDPMQRVEDIYREFLGRDPDGAVDALAPDDAPEYLAALGILKTLVTDAGTYDFDVQDGFVIAVDARGNLWVIGEHRLTPNVELGEAHELSYITEKDHLEKELLEYVHEFGESGGSRPRVYTDEEGFLRFTGGDYWITAAGIID